MSDARQRIALLLKEGAGHGVLSESQVTLVDRALMLRGVTVGEDRHLFTHLSIPVMTRLRLPERAVLDTLVETGVARSRSDALGWCVRLVARHEADWLTELQDALVHVRKVREEGPSA